MGRVLFGTGPLIILLFFLGFTALLIIHYIRTKKIIDNFMKTKEGVPSLLNIWEEYYKTFITGMNKTKSWAGDFFYMETLYSNKTQIPYLNKVPILEICKAIPNTLVGAGILGTFWGLANGISSFDTSSAVEITNSIDHLLSGIGTAFGTSISGILLSLIFNLLLLKPILGLMEKDCDEISKTLDDQYFIDESNYIYSLFVCTDEDGNKLYPKMLLKKMAEEAEQQTSALSNFSTDLADSIKNSSERMIEQYNDEIYDMYEKVLEPSMNKLNQAIEALYKEKRESASEVISEIIKDLQVSMKEMVSEFQSSLSGDTKTELEDLSTILTKAGASFSDIPELITTQFGELQKNQESQILYVDELVQSITGAIEAFSSEVEVSKQTFSSLNDVYNQINRVSSEFNEVSINIEQTSDLLKNSTEEYMNKALEIVEKNTSVSNNMENTVLSMENVTKSFSTVDQNLGGVFDQLNTGLNDYRANVKDSLESYLQKYSDSISEYADRLAGAAEAVGDGVEELNDTLSRKDKLDSRV